MTQVAETASAKLIQREIDRFIETTRERSESDGDRKRRRQRRYHRSWPLLVCVPGHSGDTDLSVALHDASPLGVAFLSPVTIPVSSLVLIKLFWHDKGCLRVPAVVRHATPTEHGYLIGCEFTLGDEARCELAIVGNRSWYD